MSVEHAVRPAAVAGMFYEAEPDVLQRQVVDFVRAGAGFEQPARAVIAPHAGFTYSGAVAGEAYACLKGHEAGIQRVYLFGPAHRVYTRGVASVSVAGFETPLGEVRIDQPRLAELIRQFEFLGVSDESHELEHSLEVQLPFLQEVWPDFKLVPLLVGDISPEKVADLMREALADDQAMVVISTDLSHYHSYDEAKAIDTDTVGLIKNLNWRQLNGQRACGYIGVSALIICAREMGLTITPLDYRNSGDTAGNKDRVVGYASFVVTDTWWSPEQKAAMLSLARRSIEHGLETGKPMIVNVEQLDPALRQNGACFVTLNRNGNLRGCIGSLQATERLAINIAGNAWRAAFEDPRFRVLQPEEINDLQLSLSLLSPPVLMPVTSEQDLIDRLKPGEDGVILGLGRQRGTFLPSVWESLPDPEQFVTALKRKAGFNADFWHDDIEVSRYSTFSFGADFKDI